MIKLKTDRLTQLGAIAMDVGRRTIDFAAEVFILDWLAALLVWAVLRGHHKKENGPGLVLWQPTSPSKTHP